MSSKNIFERKFFNARVPWVKQPTLFPFCKIKYLTLSEFCRKFHVHGSDKLNSYCQTGGAAAGVKFGSLETLDYATTRGLAYARLLKMYSDYHIRQKQQFMKTVFSLCYQNGRSVSYSKIAESVHLAGGSRSSHNMTIKKYVEAMVRFGLIRRVGIYDNTRKMMQERRARFYFTKICILRSMIAGDFIYSNRLAATPPALFPPVDNDKFRQLSVQLPQYLILSMILADELDARSIKFVSILESGRVIDFAFRTSLGNFLVQVPDISSKKDYKKKIDALNKISLEGFKIVIREDRDHRIDAETGIISCGLETFLQFLSGRKTPFL